jgi:pyrroloquinoline quinone biosynthesis protein D
MRLQLTPETVPVLAPGHRLQWEEAQQAHVLLFPEGMVTLNDSAREILCRCDGKRPVAEIIADLKRVFADADLEADVLELLGIAGEEGWIRAG